MVTTSNSLSCPLILLRWAGLESSLLLHRRRDRRPWALLTQDHQLGGVGTGIQTQKRLTTEPLPKQARVSGGLKEPGSLLLAPWAAPDPRSRRMHWQALLGMAGSWEAAFHYWERLLSRPKGAWPGHGRPYGSSCRKFSALGCPGRYCQRTKCGWPVLKKSKLKSTHQPVLAPALTHTDKPRTQSTGSGVRGPWPGRLPESPSLFRPGPVWGQLSLPGLGSLGASVSCTGASASAALWARQSVLLSPSPAPGTEQA